MQMTPEPDTIRPGGHPEAIHRRSADVTIALPETIMAGHAGLVLLLTLTTVYSTDRIRRNGAYRALRAVAPWSLITITAEIVISFSEQI